MFNIRVLQVVKSVAAAFVTPLVAGMCSCTVECADMIYHTFVSVLPWCCSRIWWWSGRRDRSSFDVSHAAAAVSNDEHDANVQLWCKAWHCVCAFVMWSSPAGGCTQTNQCWCSCCCAESNSDAWYVSLHFIYIELTTPHAQRVEYRLHLCVCLSCMSYLCTYVCMPLHLITEKWFYAMATIFGHVMIMRHPRVCFLFWAEIAWLESG